MSDIELTEEGSENPAICEICMEAISHPKSARRE